LQVSTIDKRLEDTLLSSALVMSAFRNSIAHAEGPATVLSLHHFPATPAPITSTSWTTSCAGGCQAAASIRANGIGKYTAERNVTDAHRNALARRLHALASGLTPRSVLEKFAAVEVIELHLPGCSETDARCDRRRKGGDRIECQSGGAGAILDVPLGHTVDSWSFPHFDTITVSVADAPRPDEIHAALRLASLKALAGLFLSCAVRMGLRPNLDQLNLIRCSSR
jgi:hypothetical protein